MATSKILYQAAGGYEREIVTIRGLILTDGSGDPTNINSGAVLDQYGDRLLLPYGVTSVTRPATGIYRLLLDDPFYRLQFANAFLFKSAAVKGTLDCPQWNTRSAILTAGSVPLQTVDIRYKLDGAATDLVSAGFFFELYVANQERP